MTDSEKLTAIHEVLLGDPTRGRLGLIHHHNQVMIDLYGIDPNGEEIDSKKNTILLRLSSVEDRQKKAIWVITGLIAAFTIAKSGCVVAWEKLIGK